ncbi:UNVERIFIED_CONTAM: hypothetical protein HDU68_004337 [Siphonaria sp. JEL0065]|nr:hypothetical protein HDU68_004337 [Siphonaria sp. JEL0065]
MDGSLSALRSRARHVKRLNVSNAAKDVAALTSLGAWLLAQTAANVAHVNVVVASTTQENAMSQTVSSAVTHAVDADRLIAPLVAYAALSSVSSISIRGGRPLSDARLTQLLNAFRTIHSLKLTCPAVSVDSLAQALSSITSLKNLTIAGGSQVATPLVSYLSAELSLESLSLFPKLPVLPSAFNNLGHGFRNLRSLAFDADPDENLRADWVNAFVLLGRALSGGSLQELAIGGDGVINADSFLNIASSVGSNLKKLKLHEFDSPSVDASVFVQCMRLLKKVEVVEVGFKSVLYSGSSGVGGNIGAGFTSNGLGVGGGAGGGTGRRESGTTPKYKSITPVMGVALAKGCKHLKCLTIRMDGGDDNEMGEMVMEVYQEVKREFC